MARYINLDDLIKLIKENGYVYANMLDTWPTADVVEVVRCKDCKWWQNETCTGDVATDHEGGADFSLNFGPDDFCSYGERSKMLPECDARCGNKMDRCAKWGDKRMKCTPCTVDDFESNKLLECKMEEVCRKCSIFGNDYILLTDKDIEVLKSGKVLYLMDEYGTFLAYGGETKNGKS